MAVINPLERKLAKRTSVEWWNIIKSLSYIWQCFLNWWADFKNMQNIDISRWLFSHLQDRIANPAHLACFGLPTKRGCWNWTYFYNPLIKYNEKWWKMLEWIFIILHRSRNIPWHILHKNGSGKGADQFWESILVSMYISSSKSLYMSKKCIVKKKC